MSSYSWRPRNAMKKSKPTRNRLFTVFRYRLAAGTSEKIQLSSMIAAFQVARDMVTPDS